MRILIKGGVWKNTEDEVMKAAVMKYGLNQWSRISSLLVRKSAKQCKARWYEWLDPSIKKTEWNKEEDEKLLYCSKILPNQWRSIAPIVERTASQCLERYEQLISEAHLKQENALTNDKQRVVKAKEFDVDPESRPAKPDPKDMDPDEREMLSEARARLANTKGKKAKRKAREKQLQTARRLASLQKRRELKMAGISIKKRRRRKNWIDYNLEIPFEKHAPRGIYNTKEEDKKALQILEKKKKSFKRLFIDEIEGERNDDKEIRERIKDKKKIEVRRQKNLVQVLEAESRLNDGKKIQHRPILKLVEPQITEEQLGVIAKYNEKNLTEQTITNQLVEKKKTSYVELRTPSIGRKDNSEIQMAIQFSQTQNPLIPKKNLDVKLIKKYSFQNYKFIKEKTPNILLDNSIKNLDDLAQNIFDISQGSIINLNKTPNCNLNSINTPIRKISTKQKRSKSKTLQKAFVQLPSASKDYDISQINVISEEEKLTKMKDRTDIDCTNKQINLKLEKEHIQVKKRTLEHPKKVAKIRIFSNSNNKFLNTAARILNKEMILLLKCDNDVLSSKKLSAKKYRKNIDFEYSEKYLNKAKKILVEELKKVQKIKKKKEFNEFCSFSKESNAECFYFPHCDQYDFLKNYSIKKRLDAIRQDFSILRKDLIFKMRKKYKLEKELKVILNNPIKDVELSKVHIKKYFNDYVKHENEIKVFKTLQRIEQKAILKRLNQSQQLIKLASDHEQKIQSRYQYFVHEMNHLNEIFNNM